MVGRLRNVWKVCGRCGVCFQFCLFILWMLFVSIELRRIDLQVISFDFAIDFAISTTWLQTDGWMDG